MNLDELERLEQEEIASQKKKEKKSFFKRTKKDKPDILPEDEYRGYDLKGFFIAYKRQFRRLVTVNLLTVFGNFPILFLIVAMSGAFKNDFMTPIRATADVFPAVRGAQMLAGPLSPAELLDFSLYGVQTGATAMTAMSYVCFALACLTVFTFGIVNVGTTYLMRNMIRGDHMFMWSDFIAGIKKNFKQGFIFGIFDAIILLLIPFNIFYWYSSASVGSATAGIYTTILFYLTLIFSLIYFVMRFYIYLQMITFDLKIFKILKNSLIFVVLGIKRNIMALIGIVILVGIDFLLIFGANGILVPVGISLPFLLLFSNCAFMSCYAAYFKMKEIMIDPYYDEDGNPLEAE